MDKERILSVLRAHETELNVAGLLHLRLFGSVARGENNEESDVDLLFDCDESNVLRAYGLEDRVAEILGAKVHLSSERYIKPKIRDRMLPETIHVF